LQRSSPLYVVSAMFLARCFVVVVVVVAAAAAAAAAATTVVFDANACAACGLGQHAME